MVTPGKLARRAALFEQLSTTIAAGVPLIQAIEMASRNRSTGVPRKILEQLVHHLKNGHTFTDSMQLVSGQKRDPDITTKRVAKEYWLSEFDMALLSAGEDSGRLDVSFKTLARYYASRAKLIRDTIASSIITIVTLHVFLLVFPISYLQRLALGIVNNQYSECLPFLLEKLEVFGILYGAAWFLMFSGQGNRGEGWRSGVEGICNIIPWLRSAVKYLAVARLAMALDALLNAGVPVIRAWELAAMASGSPQLKSEIFKWTPQLTQGSTPSDMVAQISYFPEMFTQLYHTGEISGRQDETLAHLHTYFEEEGNRKLQTFCRVLNFLIYFTIAITVGIFVISFWLKYYGTMLNSI